jgi:asparagine synthase (glutamine-hydrolysing)
LKKYNGIEPYYFSPTNREVEEYFHKISECVEVPLSGSSYISQYFLMKLIGDHKIKVVLDGQGSDEYLAGYMHTFYRLVADYIKKINLSRAVATTFAVNKRLNSNFSKTMLHFGKSILCVLKNEQDLYSLEYKNYFPFLFTGTNSEIPFSLPEKNGNSVTNFLYHLLFTTSLPSLLHYEDRTSMAYSIESRVPFLDHRLVEFCFKLNNDDKIKEVETKYILREALSGILPEAIKNRRDKKGFVTPGEIEWLRGPLKFLLDANFNNLDFLDQKKVNGILKDFRGGENKNANLVWRLATLNSWIGKN